MTATQPPNASVQAATAMAPRSAFDLRKSLQIGLIAGLTMVMISSMGIVETFDGRMIIHPFLSLGHALLFFIPLIAGHVAGKLPPILEGMAEPEHHPRDVLGGLISGAIAGSMLALLALLAGVIDLRTLFINVSPALISLITFNAEQPAVDCSS